MDILAIWLFVLVGLLGLVIYALTIALKSISRMVNRVSDTNEQLLVLVAHQTGGNDAARALVASAHLPKKSIPGISTKKKNQKIPKQPDEKKGVYSMDVGVN